MTSERELAGLDVPALLRAGLTVDGAARRELFGDGAVAAAVRLHQVSTIPRSVTFLAEVVRSAGCAVAAGLPEPLPRQDQTEVVGPWLGAAAEVAEHVEDDDVMATWLTSVATLLAARSGPVVSAP